MIFIAIAIDAILPLLLGLLPRRTKTLVGQSCFLGTRSPPALSRTRLKEDLVALKVPCSYSVETPSQQSLDMTRFLAAIVVETKWVQYPAMGPGAATGRYWFPFAQAVY